MHGWYLKKNILVIEGPEERIATRLRAEGLTVVDADAGEGNLNDNSAFVAQVVITRSGALRAREVLARFSHDPKYTIVVQEETISETIFPDLFLAKVGSPLNFHQLFWKLSVASRLASLGYESLRQTTVNELMDWGGANGQPQAPSEEALNVSLILFGERTDVGKLNADLPVGFTLHGALNIATAQQLFNQPNENQILVIDSVNLDDRLFQFIEDVRRIRFNYDKPILLMNADASEAVRCRAFSSGVSDIFPAQSSRVAFLNKLGEYREQFRARTEHMSQIEWLRDRINQSCKSRLLPRKYLDIYIGLVAQDLKQQAGPVAVGAINMLAVSGYRRRPGKEKWQRIRGEISSALAILSRSVDFVTELNDEVIAFVLPATSRSGGVRALERVLSTLENSVLGGLPNLKRYFGADVGAVTMVEENDSSEKIEKRLLENLRELS